jgi:hypothetical protein
MLPSALPLGVQVLVLCAEWCSQCRSFLPLVQGLPGLHWVDIEDAGLDAEELGISAFPSVAIFRPTGVLRYLGPVRADLDGFLSSVAQLSRLDELPVPAALRVAMGGPYFPPR